MPGPYVTDATAPNLLAGSTLGSAGTTNGTVVELDWPHDVTFVLTTGPTILIGGKIVIMGSESSTFAGTFDVTIATFDIVATDDAVVRQITAFVDSKYVRTTVTVSGSGDLTGTTLVAQTKHYNRTRLNTASALT